MYPSGRRIFSEDYYFSRIFHIYLTWISTCKTLLITPIFRWISFDFKCNNIVSFSSSEWMFLTQYLSRRIDKIERIIRYLIMIITIINSEEKKIYRIYCLNNSAYMNRISFSSAREEVWSLMIVYHISNLIIWRFFFIERRYN